MARCLKGYGVTDVGSSIEPVYLCSLPEGHDGPHRDVGEDVTWTDDDLGAWSKPYGGHP